MQGNIGKTANKANYMPVNDGKSIYRNTPYGNDGNLPNYYPEVLET